MLKIRFVAFAALLVALPALAEEKDKKSDSSKLIGTYTIVKGERDGKSIPKEDFEKSVVVFGKEKIYGHDKDKKEFFGATYTLDTTAKPWKISMVSTSPKKGEKAEGLIEMDGDDVKLCYALPGGKTPTSFKAGEKQQFFVLKRTKDEKKE
jgi:uncharacterized protein (TIGR03067 family)